MLINHSNGNYTFIKGIGPFSSGCKAQPGYEVVHTTFHPLPALQQGFELIEHHLQRLGRPIQAVCGMELRIPQSLSPQAFNEFNAPYIQRLADWNILVDGVNPVARTNVALAVHPVAEPSLYGFSYTVPVQHQDATFVLSGCAETRTPQDEDLVVDPLLLGAQLIERDLIDPGHAVLREIGFHGPACLSRPAAATI